ncbi:MAG TPA: class IV adenylate cyclase [Saprospiraceae bacterium]|nr:class IV adenylate cyclase [Saprospiraceae bacterium]
MKIKNVEIKAQCHDPQGKRDILITQGARYIGRDHQIDTYYQTPHGRLKLRRGNIENALIAYTRENVRNPKLSDVLLYKTYDAASLQEILDRTFDRQIVVDKTRDIYFIDNIKFHVDDVQGLGTFVEIEAIDEAERFGEDELRKQVTQYMKILGITHEDLLTHSYSDMIPEHS